MKESHGCETFATSGDNLVTSHVTSLLDSCGHGCETFLTSGNDSETSLVICLCDHGCETSLTSGNDLVISLLIYLVDSRVHGSQTSGSFYQSWLSPWSSQERVRPDHDQPQVVEGEVANGAN